MEYAVKTLAILAPIERLFIRVAFTLMTCAIVIDVGAREIQGSGFTAAPRLAVFAMIFVSFFGMTLASARDAHLRPRFLDSLLPDAWEPVLVRCQELTFALFCLIAAALGLHVVHETYLLGEVTRTLKLTLWPLQVILPLAFTMTALHHVIYGLYPVLRPSALKPAADQDGAR